MAKKPKMIPTTQRINLGPLSASVGNLVKRVDNTIPAYNSRMGGFSKGKKYFMPTNKSGTKYVCYSQTAKNIRNKISRDLEKVQVALVKLETLVDVCKEEKTTSSRKKSTRRKKSSKKKRSRKKTRALR